MDVWRDGRWRRATTWDRAGLLWRRVQRRLWLILALVFGPILPGAVSSGVAVLVPGRWEARWARAMGLRVPVAGYGEALVVSHCAGVGWVARVEYGVPEDRPSPCQYWRRVLLAIFAP